VDVFEALIQTLESRDWSRALALALDAWRTTRSPELADAVEAIAARITPPTPPVKPNELHAWWVEQAIAPDPVTVGALLATLTTRPHVADFKRDDLRARWLDRTGNPMRDHLVGQTRRYTWVSNFQERFALVLEMPDDPRIALALVDCIVHQPPSGYGFTELHDLIADRIGALGDRRIRAQLELLIAEPRGTNRYLRERQVATATRALAALDRRPDPVTPPRLDDILALAIPPPPPPSPKPPDLSSLWNEVATHPDDIGPRIVLGDALIELGDLRGELIALQCNARSPGRPLRGSDRSRYDGRVRTLVRKCWRDWLGDLALAIMRRSSEYRCGMLEVVRVGSAETPPWVYGKAAGHRELVAVHTVRPGWIAAPDLATFLSGLPRFPTTLAVDRPVTLDVIAKLPGFEQVRTLELIQCPETIGRGLTPGFGTRPLEDTLDIASRAAGLTELYVSEPAIAVGVFEALPSLRSRFPALERIAITPRVVASEPRLPSAAGVAVVDPR